MNGAQQVSITKEKGEMKKLQLCKEQYLEYYGKIWKGQATLYDNTAK